VIRLLTQLADEPSLEDLNSLSRPGSSQGIVPACKRWRMRSRVPHVLVGPRSKCAASIDGLSAKKRFDLGANWTGSSTPACPSRNLRQECSHSGNRWVPDSKLFELRFCSQFVGRALDSIHAYSSGGPPPVFAVVGANRSWRYRLAPNYSRSTITSTAGSRINGQPGRRVTNAQ